MHSILPHTDNPTLKQIAQDIRVSDIQSSRIQTLIADMKALLAKEEYGVALAAPQVGKSVRLFIVSGTAAEKRAHANKTRKTDDAVMARDSLPARDEVYINPELIKMSRGRKDKHEGCLSVRGKWGMVPRAEKATVRAYDEHGVQFTRGASGLLAQIFQHELDHLNGILYLDKAREIFEESSDTVL